MQSPDAFEVLSSEQVDALRETDIDLNFLTHGHNVDSQNFGEYANGVLDSGYTIASELVGRLDVTRGDALAIETVNYNRVDGWWSSANGGYYRSVMNMEAVLRGNVIGRHWLSKNSGRVHSGDELVGVVAASHAIDPIHYAAMAAGVKNLPVAYADMSQAESEAWDETTDEITESHFLKKLLNLERVKSLEARDLSMVSRLGDVAIDMQRWRPGEERPRLGFIAGLAHQGVKRYLDTHDIAYESKEEQSSTQQLLNLLTVGSVRRHRQHQQLKSRLHKD